MKSVFVTKKGMESMEDECRRDSSHDQAREPEPHSASNSNSPRQHDTDRESIKTPWIALLIVGLLMGTVLGWLIEDMTVGTASGVAGTFVVGALWAYIPPRLRERFSRT